MAKKSLTENLTYVVNNTVTKNPESHPEKWYLEIDQSSKRTVNMPVEDCVTININEE